MTIAALLSSVPFALFGLVLGLFHFWGLNRMTRVIVTRGASPTVLLAQLGRILGTCGALFLVAFAGIVPLLAAFLAFFGARMVAVSRVKRGLI